MNNLTKENNDSLTQFDYKDIDSTTSKMLRDKAYKINQITNRSAFEIGKELKEAQEELAKNGYGIFEEWYATLGFKKTKAYQYINHYNFVCSESEQSKIELFESAPKSIQAEISKPSANEDVNEAYFNGDITTLKEFKEMEKKYKEELQKKDEEIKWISKNKDDIAMQLEREQNKEPEVITQTVERVVVPDDYEDLEKKSKKLEGKVFQLNRQLEKIREIDSYEAKAESIKQEVEYLNSERQKLKHIFDSAERLQQLERKFNDFFDTEMAPLKYKPLINDLTNTNGVSRMKEMVNLARAWVEDMDRMLPDENRQIIEAEMVESKNE